MVKEKLEKVIMDYIHDKNIKGLDACDMAKYLMKAINNTSLKRSIGSKVRIKTDLVPGHIYDGTGFEQDMVQYIGMEAEIVDFDKEEDCAPAYLLDVDNEFWSWSDSMLEDIN